MKLRTRRCLASALAALLLLPCAGCGGQEEAEGTEYVLYTVSLRTDAPSGSIFSAGDTLLLEEETDTESAARALVSALLEANSGLFPEGTRLQHSFCVDGVLTLSFSEEYGQLSGVRLTEAEYALTLTLCQLDGVDGVRILLEGTQIPVGPSGVLTPEQVLEDGEPEDTETEEEQTS